MALIDAGALEFDRPLIDYVAEPYLADDERAASITARMVLSHTTGFPNWREDGPLFLRWLPGTRWGTRVSADRLAGVILDTRMARVDQDVRLDDGRPRVRRAVRG